MDVIKKIEKNIPLYREDFFELLINKYNYYEKLAYIARENHIKSYGNTIFFRGLIEISSYCSQNCLYCGIRRSNKEAQRYRMNFEEIVRSIDNIFRIGFRTVVLQSGEDKFINDEFIIEIIQYIKINYPEMAITLSLGERTYESYKKLKDAGANRYLLRHESANKNHFSLLHPSDQTLDSRIKCIENLISLGYQVGMGMMIGSPYQTIFNIIDDFILLQKFKPQMVGIGPFIHHENTPFGKYNDGSVDLTLFIISIVRSILPNALIPLTTAMTTLDKKALEKGILVGCNVVMPNMSPEENKKKYLLYKNKADYKVLEQDNLIKLKERIRNIGYKADMSAGHYNELLI